MTNVNSYGKENSTMKKPLIMSLATGIIAVFLAVADFFVAKCLYPGASFLWVAFISWAAFGNISTREKISALPSYVIGFIVAFLMGSITSSLEIMIKIYILASCVSIFIFNVLIVYLSNFRQFKAFSVSAIFLGLALAFSGLGVNLRMDSFRHAMIMLGIILIYGALGLLAGELLGKLSKRLDKFDKKLF